MSDSERGKEAHGGCAKGIPRNWWVFPFSIPMKVPASSLTSGSLGSEAATNPSWPQVSFDFGARPESCTVTCMVKEFKGEAREKRARVASKARVARLTSMTREGFAVEGLPEFELLHESSFICISVQGDVDIKVRAVASIPGLKVAAAETEMRKCIILPSLISLACPGIACRSERS